MLSLFFKYSFTHFQSFFFFFESRVGRFILREDKDWVGSVSYMPLQIQSQRIPGWIERNTAATLHNSSNSAIHTILVKPDQSHGKSSHTFYCTKILFHNKFKLKIHLNDFRISELRQQRALRVIFSFKLK